MSFPPLLHASSIRLSTGTTASPRYRMKDLVRGAEITFRAGGASPRTPSGFGLSSPSPTYPTVPVSPNDSTQEQEERKSLKGHPVSRVNNILGEHPFMMIGFGVLVLCAMIWLIVVPMKIRTEVDIHQQAPMEQERLTHLIEVATEEAPTTTTIVEEQPTQSPTIVETPQVQQVQPQQQTPEPTQPQAQEQQQHPAVSEPETPKQHVDTSPLSANNPAAEALSRADLIDSELHCHEDKTTTPAQCDFSWGPEGSQSANSEDHKREELDSKQTGFKKPQDLYTFQAGILVTGEGPGAVVRIRMRDLCCSAAHMPLSYFRITAHGASQAASNPPLALGARPKALGRGHQAVHLAQQNWGADVRLENVDEERVIQTFLLLPDPGFYEIQVLLLHYNVSSDMISENYQMNSKMYNLRPGFWVNDHVKNSRGEIGTKLFVHEHAASRSRAYTDRRSNMPLCGFEGDGKLAGVSHTGTRYGMPLAGRWVFQPPNNANPLVDYTGMDRKFLVEHSEWRPYFCNLDHKVPYSDALEKVQWMHFTGDSNTRHMFYYVCELGNGTLTSVNGQRVPRRLDPPHACIGPSSKDNLPDAQTGLKVGSEPRWVLTYTNWFWGKPQTLDEPDFGFRTQCNKFVEQNQTGLFYGWPDCQLLPEWIQQLSGPGVTYFGWGSHAAEFGANPLTEQYFDTEEAFRLPFFYKHPIIFPLTTANIPSLIPEKFGRQQLMRNNERVHASNLHLVDAVMKEHLKYATHTPGGSTDPSNVIPLFDLFSPSHAAYDVIAVDAVHFDKFFSYEEPKWLMHYIYHSPNFGQRTQTN